MKKFANVCAALFAIGALTLISFIAINVIKGNHIEVYTRFSKEVDGKKAFNLLGLLSPIQVESQHTITDTAEIITAVGYPVAPKFQCVAPTGTPEEVNVAHQIAKQIEDTVNSISITSWLDYDATSSEVRNAANPNTITVAKPKIILHLEGTASPEAAKDGFMASVQPNVYEPENADLAKQRLDRTTHILLDRLHSKGIDTVHMSKKSYELQFSKSVTDSIWVISQLGKMRYVSAYVLIPMSKLEVSTITVPILLPFWLGLITWTLIFLAGLFKSKKKEEEEKSKSTNWSCKKFFQRLIAVLLWIAMIVACVYAIYLFWKIIVALLIIITLGLIIYGLYRFIRYTNWSEVWKSIKRFFRCVLHTIMVGICWAILFILITLVSILDWWRSLKCKCFIWKLLLAISVIINILFYLHWKGLWPF